jgi:hypothetical protein
MRPRHALILGLGLVVLANSRPYEGLVASLPVAALLIVRLFGKRRPKALQTLRSVVAPLAIVLGLAAAAMGYYNFRLAGNSLRLPYLAGLVEGQDQAISSLLLSPALTNPEKVTKASASRVQRLLRIWRVFFGLLFTVALVMLPWVLRNRWMRFAALDAGLVLLAILLQNSDGYPHYASPVVPLLILLVVQGLRQLQQVGREHRGRRWSLGPVIVLGQVVFFVAALFAGINWFNPDLYPARSPYMAHLENEEGQHVVFLRYAPGQKRATDWVYNRADLDTARVIWVREMGNASDRQLVALFPGRRIWLLEADVSPYRLFPHPDFAKERKKR